MWNGRFSAESGDPFDNSHGFLFPPPEGLDRFPPEDAAPPGDPGNLNDLVTFVRDGLYDDRAAPEVLCTLVPSELPGGRPVELDFETCPPPKP